MFSPVTQVGSIFQLAPPVESLKWCKIPHDNLNDTNTIGNEQEFDRLLPTLLQCFAIVFCGFLAGRCNLISSSDIKGLNDFTTYFTLPPLIFLNLVTIDFHNVNWYFVLGVLVGKICVFSLVAFVTASVQRPVNLSYAGIYGIFCTQGNDFGLAYPIVSSLYGTKRPLYAGYMYLIAPTSLLFTNPMGFFLMEAQRNRVSKNNSKGILQTMGKVSWSVFKNPVVFVTLLGMLGNFLFKNNLPSLLYGVLQILSSAFSSAVLFLLGFSVVRFGSSKTSKEGLLIPCVIILAKMLVSPLVMRGTVSLLCSGSPDVDDLSDYGFLYGMIPTGPIVMLFANEYALKTEMMASTMVVCTALFGPVIFFLGRMLSFKVRGIGEFAEEMKTTMLVLSILSIVSCIWTVSCFIIGKKIRKRLYKITSFLILSQIIMSIGVLMWSTLDSDISWIGFLEMVFVAAGQLMSRLWVAILALQMTVGQRNPASPFIQNLSWPMAFGFGIPAAAIVMLLVMTSVGKCQPNFHKVLPYFIYGDAEAMASAAVLSVCLMVTTISLVLYFRALSRTKSSKKSDSENPPSLGDKIDFCLFEENGIAAQKLKKSLSDSVIMTAEEKKKERALEELNHRYAQENIGKNFPSRKKDDLDDSQSSLDVVSVSSTSQATCSTSTSSINDIDDLNRSHRNLRHVIIIILCSVSMALGLTVSTWKLSTKNTSGLFVATEFIDAVLNAGQGVFILFIFWRESRHIFQPISKWIRRLRRGIYNLDNEVETDTMTTQICKRFRKYHWDTCNRDLPKTFSTEEKSYSHCFTGKEFVDWLLAVGLANHRTMAEVHGQQLLHGGLLQSANGAVQFHDNHAYFYRLKDSAKYT